MTSADVYSGRRGEIMRRGEEQGGRHSPNDFSTISARKQIELPVQPRFETVACQTASITLKGTEDEQSIAVGEKLTLMAHLAPAARLEPQLPVSEELMVAATPAMLSVVEP